MKKFENKVVVVTGAARGQGVEHSLSFARDGAIVYALDLRDDLGAELEAKASREGLDVRYRNHDVGDEASWKDLTSHIENEHGAVHVLVNNAGIVHTCDLKDEDVTRFERVLHVNVTGVFLGMKSLWQLLQTDGGSVINVASVYGLFSSPGYAAYTASKAAVIGITKTAAVEGATIGIRVNAVSPGTVLTPMLKDEGSTYVLDNTPMARGAMPVEISNAIRFLASDDASFITGTELRVDGGFTAR